MTYTLELKEETARKLEEKAKMLGVTPEELLAKLVSRAAVAEAPPFDAAAQHVLSKNADLYRRLA